MKIYSDTSVSKTDLDHIDAKQSQQIAKLRIIVGVCFAVNLLLTSIAFFIR